MEADRVGVGEDYTPVLIEGKRYTPREFAERIWTQRDLAFLKSEIGGKGLGDERGNWRVRVLIRRILYSASEDGR